jgi:adenylylsulfate kinase
LGSTFERSFVKGVVWEFISFLIAILIAYLYYGDFPDSIKFALILTVIKIPFFFIHERAWKKIRWGKIRDRKRK